MKTCARCTQEFSLENFSTKRGKPQPYCRPCKNEFSRAYYAANREVHKAAVARRTTRYRQELKTLIRTIKEATPCLDCGVSYPWYVMDFDHVTGEKYKDVSAMVSNLNSKQKVLDEIAKCELICSNCHRVRTFTRLGLSQEDALISINEQ